MDHNIYFVDPCWINKVIVASHRKDNGSLINPEDCTESNISQTFISRDNGDPISFLSCEESDEISLKTQEELQSLIRVDENNRAHVFMPCVEDGHFVMKPAQEPFDQSLGCEAFVTEVNSREPIESSEIGENVQSNASTQSQKPTRFHSSKASNSFPSLVSDQKASMYSSERYSIYSGSKTRLRCRVQKDQMTMIHPKLFKRQLLDASDTIRPALTMPSTKRAMDILGWTISKAFLEPSVKVCQKLASKHSRSCCTRREPDEQDARELGLLPVGFQPPIDRSKIKRITRKRRPAPQAAHIQHLFQHLSGNTFIKSEYVTSRPASQSGFHPSLEGEDIDSPLEVYVPSEGRECLLYSEMKEEGLEGQQIIVIHDPEGGEGSAHTKSSIEVLLAAATEGQMPPGKFFFCQDSQTEIEIGSDDNSVTSESQSSLILLNSYESTEEVLPLV